MTPKIQSLMLLSGNGSDKIVIYFNIPTGCWPYEGPATATMECAQGKGEAYILEHFPNIPYRNIRTR